VEIPDYQDIRLFFADTLLTQEKLVHDTYIYNFNTKTVDFASIFHGKKES